MKKKRTFKDIINGEKPVLVDFFAEWCGPCKAMAPVLKEVVQGLGDQVKVIKLDVDKNQALAAKLQVRGVPTLVIYHKGEVKWRESGMKSSAYLKGLLEKYIA